jgi:hypothetical protein
MHLDKTARYFDAAGYVWMFDAYEGWIWVDPSDGTRVPGSESQAVRCGAGRHGDWTAGAAVSLSQLRRQPVGTLVRDDDGDLYARLSSGSWVVLESPNDTAYVGTEDYSKDLRQPVMKVNVSNG